MKNLESWEILENPELGRFQLSKYRFWHEESDFQVKIEQFWRPEVFENIGFTIFENVQKNVEKSNVLHFQL